MQRAEAATPHIHGSELSVRMAGVSRVFGKGRDTNVALENVDLDIEPGEFISVVGPSGCGKSTLLKMIAGLLGCSEGTITIGGEKLEGTRADIGLMFQTATLFPWRTVFDNIRLPFQVHRDKSVDVTAKVEEVLELVGLSGLQDRYPRQLSGGMQQRVALCRLLVSDPDLMLMDEPFGALDEFTRERLNIELARIAELEGKTTVFVTHNITEAIFLADRVVAMGTEPGRVLDVIDIDLPRPRESSMFTSPELIEKVQEVRKVLGLA
ncbi:MAG: ATP-binding cassette domain-containing protein [Actinobacteria bacterium]|nr:ATP-binding cassette domain-containing protein [Actinomycetota bacterium]